MAMELLQAVSSAYPPETARHVGTEACFQLVSNIEQTITLRA